MQLVNRIFFFRGNSAPTQLPGVPPRCVVMALAAVLMLGLGCGDETNGPSGGEQGCLVNADCDSGYRCEGGVCVPESSSGCTENSDCEPGYRCEGGVCVPEELLDECVGDDCCGENAYCQTTEEGSVCVCEENYERRGDECVPKSRVADCTNTKPDNSSWTPEYIGGKISQTWDGDAFVPPADTCEWECNPGYHEHQEGGSIKCSECFEDEHCSSPTPYCSSETRECVECDDDQHCGSGEVCAKNACAENPRTFTCSSFPGSGAEWNTVSEYQQEWNHDTQTWEPEDSETEYNEEPDDQSCRYTCIDGYWYNGEECEERPVCSTGDKLDDGGFFGGTDVTAEDLLNAMGICQVYQQGVNDWGIVQGSAKLTRADGSGSPNARQYGVKTQFGTDASNKPIFGNNFALLSSGRARDAHDSSPTEDHSYSHTLFPGSAPDDFTAPHGNRLPRTREDCPQGMGIYDDAKLSVELKVPPFAHGFSFDFRFFSQEYMDYTCTDFNDFFITMLDTVWTPQAGQEPIPEDKNISFDAAGNYISVNSEQFFTVCEPKTCEAGDLTVDYDCPEGLGALSGTGYDPENAGATTWLTTTAPVAPGETIKLRFIIWDTSDPNYDSLVILDNFRWHAQQAESGPITQPVAP